MNENKNRMKNISLYSIILSLNILLFSACSPKKQTTPSSSGTDTVKNTVDKSTDSIPPGTTALKVPNVPFSMFGGDKAHTNRALVPGPVIKPVITATFDTGGRIPASPVIGPDGTVYIGSVDGTFNALRQDGTLRWNYVCSEPFFSTAAISKSGLVYAGCDDNTLLAFTTDGVLRFSFRTGEDMDSPPVIDDDGTIYTGGDALNALDSGGNLKWKAILNRHASSSPSVRSDGSVVIGSHDNRLYAFAKDGTALFAYGTGDKILGTAAILDNDDIIFGGDTGFIYRLSGKNGGMRWKFDTKGPVRGGIAISKDNSTLYTGSMSGYIFAVNAKDGTLKWKIPTGGSIVATPTLDSAENLYIGSRDHNLYAVDTVKGTIMWKKDLMGEIDSTVAIASGQKLVVGCDNHIVYFLGK
ncbi:MAG: PQQ-like beta-propeller repeat protein [Deltaproteobacteria bacterium]|nr:PQQ-like beta-propeller repeat protein [Deltaproteobacteria bacterium]